MLILRTRAERGDRGPRVTSDYLKQLQLTKQLEQKAKEATKNRKAAEEKLAEAERSLSGARSMGVDVQEVQDALAVGQAAYAKRDYSTALATALKVLEDLLRLQGIKTEEVLESALGVLALITEQGNDRQAVEALVASSRAQMAAGRPLEAMADAVKAGEAAEQYADRRMSAMFSQAQLLVDLAEEKRLAVSAKKQLLAKAVKLHEDGDREGALAKLGSCFKGLQESFSKLLEGRIAALMEMVEEAAGAGGNVSTVTAKVDVARRALSDGEIVRSFQVMTAAEEAIVPILTRAVEVKLAAQDERAEWLRGQGMNLVRYLSASRKAADAASEGDGEGSLEWLRRSEKALRDSEVELVLGHIEKLRPRLVLARKINADIDNVVSRLEEARTATVYGKGREALELVSEASAELNDSLADYRELGEELQLTREVFLQARLMKIISSEATGLVTRSRQSALGGRLRESVDLLSEARELLLRKVQDHLARDLLNGELLVTTGWSVGADVDEPAGELEALTEALMEGSIENIGQRLGQTIQALEDGIRSTAAEMVEEAERMTEPALGLSELSDLRKRYEEAEALLEKDQWYRAYALAEEVIDEARKVQRVALDKLTAQARSLLEIGRQLGVESQTLNQKMIDIEAGRESFSLSIRSVNGVILYSRSLIKDEVTSSLTQLMRSSVAARKNGVTTASVDRLADEASKALAAEDMEKGFDLLREAEAELDKTTAVHNEVYDLIVVLSRLTAELRLPPEGKMPQLLQETKVLFEAGRYDGARTSARKCYQEAEAVGAEVLAPHKVQEARELVPVLQHLGLSTAPAEEAVKEALSRIQAGKHAEALVLVKDARRRMVDLVSDRIGAEIEEIKGIMVQGGEDKESTAMAIIEKAESLLAEKRYSDALRAIRFARSEANQLVALRASVGLELARVEDALGEIESLGIDPGDARAVFEQAYRYRSSNRYNLVVEMARRALHTGRTAADERMNADLAMVEAELNIGDLEGEDLEQVQRDIKGVFLQKMEQHRYTEARKALEIYRDGLRALAELKDQCTSSLSKLAEALVRVPRGSTVMEETERLMTAAQKAYSEGAFHECLGLNEECRASGAAALQWHDRCSKRLEDIAEGLLIGDGRRYLDSDISALMDSARKALSEGRYEDMDWALLKGSRLHRRARKVAARGDVAELVNLVHLFPSLELGLDDLPSEAKALLDLPLAELAEARNLGETIGAVRGRARRGIETRLAAVREKAERSPVDASISLSLLSIAQRSLAEEKLEQAVELVRDAERAVGASMTEVQELRALSHRYHELAATADGLGADAHHRDLYRQALRSRDVPSTLHRLKEAVSAAEKVTAAGLPHLELRSSELFNRGHSPALQITLDGTEEQKVLWPHRSIRLPDGAGKDGRVSLSYRALFITKPFAAVVGPSA